MIESECFMIPIAFLGNEYFMITNTNFTALYDTSLSINPALTTQILVRPVSLVTC